MPAPSDQTPGESPTFNDLALSDAVLKGLRDVGYESPSPIQAATIPHLLAGSDVVGQAQTGTGKTAAFALPILSKIDVSEAVPQALVLVPTRELAIQVAEAFQKYASYMQGFHVLPVYGGQSYTPQLHSLRRGVHVIVATPGRAMDHIKRGTLNLSSLRHLVLDEADEMLRMGFIDDVEWILEQIPAERQIALFSATMPAQVRRIAQHHLRSPAEVTIKSKTTTASKIRQRYWIVSGMHKLDALTRILEAEPFDAMLVFTRTKIATEELAERLSARGFAVEALNGDIAQVQRERTIARLKSGQIDIVVATDVAARGLDVERVSHVVNYDVPYDPESYVHRIGRTGRAGRSGEAILFIAPRERNMLRVIERATRQSVEQMQVPSIEDVNERRVAKFNEKLTAAIAANAGQRFLPLIESYERDNNVSAVDIAAALASIAQGATPLLLEPQSRASTEPWSADVASGDRSSRRERAPRPDRSARNEKFAKRERELRRREGEEQQGEAARPDWSSQDEAGADVEAAPPTENAPWGSPSASRERASRTDRESRSTKPERDHRDESFESRERTSRKASFESRERTPRSESSSTSERGARASWTERNERGAPRERQRRAAAPEDGDRSEQPAAINQSPLDQETQVDQGPRPLNRRERRALERAERERQGLTGEGAAENVSERAGNAAGRGDQASASAAGGQLAEAGDDRAAGSEQRHSRDDESSRAARRPHEARDSDEGRAREGRDRDEDRPRKRPESRASDERAPSRKSGSAEDERPRKGAKAPAFGNEERSAGRDRTRAFGDERSAARDFGDEKRPRRGGDEDVETYRIEVGEMHGVKPGNIVGAIANEVGLEGKHIGRVVIREDHSFVDLPSGMPKDVFRQLQKVRVAGQPLQISRALKTHVEKLRRERPSAPKFRKQTDSSRTRAPARGPRDTKRRR